MSTPKTPTQAATGTVTRSWADHRTRVRMAAVAASVLAAAATWLIAVPLAGVELSVERWDGAGTMTVSFAQVATIALVASLAGWAALALLERITRHARVVWATGATVVLLASLAMPATAATTNNAAITLALFHIVVGAALIPTLARSAR